MLKKKKLEKKIWKTKNPSHSFLKKKKKKKKLVTQNSKLEKLYAKIRIS